MICDRCGRSVPLTFYTEVYNPKTTTRLTVYCCSECQVGLSKTILGFVAGQLPTDVWTDKKLEEVADEV